VRRQSRLQVDNDANSDGIHPEHPSTNGCTPDAPTYFTRTNTLANSKTTFKVGGTNTCTNRSCTASGEAAEPGTASNKGYGLVASTLLQQGALCTRA
jgi:hypothetical protein